MRCWTSNSGGGARLCHPAHIFSVRCPPPAFVAAELAITSTLDWDFNSFTAIDFVNAVVPALCRRQSDVRAAATELALVWQAGTLPHTVGLPRVELARPSRVTAVPPPRHALPGRRYDGTLGIIVLHVESGVRVRRWQHQAM